MNFTTRKSRTRRAARAASIFATVIACLPMIPVLRAQEANPLQESDPKVRERAARQLGQDGNPADVPTLAAAVQDKDEKVRMAVVRSLIRLGSPASLPPLSKAVQDGIRRYRSLAIDGLVNFYLPGYVDTGFGGFFRSIGGKVEGLFSDIDTTVIAPDVVPDPEVIHTLAVALNGAPDTQTRVRAAARSASCAHSRHPRTC